MTGHDPQAVRWIRFRLWFCGVAFVLLLGGIMSRAVWLQVVRSEKLTELARDQYLRDLELEPRRGPIVDAKGKPLATSVDAHSVHVDARRFARPDGDPKKPVEPEDVEIAARKLARALGLDTATVLRKVRTNHAFVWIKRRVHPDEAKAVVALKIPGVHLKREWRRFYPQRELAANVVGLVGLDNEGLEGVERAWDAALRGDVQEVRALRDVRGRSLFAEPGVPSGALMGATVELTIDSTLQHVAQDALARGVAKAKAAAGVLVAMDPQTGALLALANVPTFNPNSPSTAAARRNRVATDLWEPGSTIKSFVVAGALADRLVAPNGTVHVSGGAITIGRKTIRDSHRPERDDLSLTEILAKSSNVGTARLGLKMGPERLVEWLRAFGFGERPGTGMPGEARGVLQDPRRMGEIGIATTSFGQGMSASALQVTAALAVIANGGALLRPYVVRKVTTAAGEVVLDRTPEIVRQVLPPEVAQATARMMVAVTEKGGTGTHAAIPGVKVAGKTGTAQKADPVTRGYGSKRFASFMGFAPADAPRIAIFVGLDEPQGDVYGGVIAAPIFREVASEALRQMGVLVPAQGAVVATVDPAESSFFDESLIEGIDGVLEGETDVTIEAGEAGGRVEVPDLRGLSSRAALRLLAARGLEIELDGAGRVRRQEPEPHRQVATGTPVRVSLGVE